MSTTTKRISHDAVFTNLAATDPEGALAYMLMSAFGVSLDQVTSAVNKMIATNDTAVAQACITSAVQIRGNVTFVTTNYAKIRSAYPVFVIDSTRDVGDQFNFSAIHVAGHVICSAAKDDLAKKILSKVGNCVTGTVFPTNAAGKINGEIRNSWSPDELAAFAEWMKDLSKENVAVLDGFFASAKAKHAAFAAKHKDASKPTIPTRAATKE